jgi:hypothetical protein
MSDVDITELDELQAAKVSGVATPANGTSFMLIKAAADEDAEKSDCPEADEFEEEVLKNGEITSKALSAADRKAMPTSSFAFVDKKGGKHLPIHDEAHAKAALSRFGKQDFSEAKGSAADAKQAAARKIKSAAAKHGIEVSDETDVATAAKKGAVQASLNGTQTPQEAGHLETGHSQTSGAVTAGTRPGPTDSSLALGGATTAQIPDASKVDQDSPIPTTTDAAGIVGKGIAVASLVQAMDAIDVQRAAVKDGKYLQVAIDAISEPKTSLSDLTSTLASCVGTLEEYLLCERVEAAVDPSERSDVWDLEEAKCALESTLRLVAIFATMESLEGEMATKNLDVQQLLAVRQTLDDAIGVVKATQADSVSETEETIHMDVTKDELAETIAAGTVAAVEAAFKAKADADEAEKAEAEKNANNGGDISEADIKPTKETDADDVNAVKGEADEADPAASMADQLEAVTKGLESLQETVTKFAKRPRSGGPSLDGQARGAHPAAEGRQSDVIKSESDSEIETLEKTLADAKDPLMKDELGRKLTYARLMKMHESGQL